jgi:hypothetical protein
MRFHGKVGYGESVEAAPGVFTDQITEFSYFGDVIRDSRSASQGETVNPDISVGNQISIVADEQAREHFFAIRYVEWQGVLWTVPTVEIQHPRLLLSLGEVYHGPAADAP